MRTHYAAKPTSVKQLIGFVSGGTQVEHVMHEMINCLLFEGATVVAEMISQSYYTDFFTI